MKTCFQMYSTFWTINMESGRKKARSIRMTAAWHHVQWSAPSPSFLKNCYTGAAGPSFPITAKLQLWHPITPLFLSFVLFSGWNKQVLQVAYLLASRIFYSVFFLPITTVPFFFLLASPLFLETLMQIPFRQLKDFHWLQWVFESKITSSTIYLQ